MMSDIKQIKNIDVKQIALSEDAVAKGDFVKSEKVKTKFWGDNGTILEAVPKEVNGKTVYRVDEILFDDNGREVKRVGMGFTTKEAVEANMVTDGNKSNKGNSPKIEMYTDSGTGIKNKESSNDDAAGGVSNSPTAIPDASTVEEKSSGSISSDVFPKQIGDRHFVAAYAGESGELVGCYDDGSMITYVDGKLHNISFAEKEPDSTKSSELEYGPMFETADPLSNVANMNNFWKLDVNSTINSTSNAASSSDVLSNASDEFSQNMDSTSATALGIGTADALDFAATTGKAAADAAMNKISGLKDDIVRAAAEAAIDETSGVKDVIALSDYFKDEPVKSGNVFNFASTDFPKPNEQTVEDVARYNKYMSDIYFALKNTNLFSPAQIAGIMANMKDETNSYFNPGTNYERVGSDDPAYKDLYFYDAKTGKKIDLDLSSSGAVSRALASRGIPSKGGIGIIQWTGDRKDKYVAWCNENGYEWDDINHQVEYFAKEYTSDEWSEFRKKFEKTRSSKEAARVFCADFEKPKNSSGVGEERAADSDKFYDAILAFEEKEGSGRAVLKPGAAKGLRDNTSAAVDKVSHIPDNCGIADVENSSSDYYFPDNGGNNKVPQFFQGHDSSWANVRFGDHTLAKSGCSVVSFAMNLSFWGIGNKGFTFPDDVVQKIIDETSSRFTYHVKDVGADSASLFPKLAEWYNMDYAVLSKNNGDSVVKSLKDGKPIVAHCSRGSFTTKGHFIVLTGVTDDGKIVINDPNYNNYTGNRDYVSTKDYTFDELVNMGVDKFWQFTPKNMDRKGVADYEQ